MTFLIKFVQTVFFVGLAGCSVVILLSWIDILKDGLTKDPDPKISE